MSLRTISAISAFAILSCICVVDMQFFRMPTVVTIPIFAHSLLLVIGVGAALYILSFAIPSQRDPIEIGRWLPELDGLRAIAALSVVIAHSCPLDISTSNGTYLLWCIVPFMDNFHLAGMGVVFFYALSAFLLTYLNISRKEHSSIGSFYFRRIVRIWPLYFTVLISLFLYFGSSEAGGSFDWYQQHWYYWVFFVSNWSLARLWGGHYVQIGSFSVLWSISVEEQFYAFFPWIKNWMLASRRNALIVGILFLIVAYAMRISFLYRENGFGMYYATTSYLEVFLAGGYAGYLTAKGQVPTWLRGRYQIWIFVSILLVLGYFWHMTWTPPYATTGTGKIFAVSVYSLLAMVFICVLLWVVANRDSLLCRFLACPLMSTLGILSFGIYVWHVPANIVTRKFETAGWLPKCALEFMDLRQLICLLLNILVAIAFACVSYALVERPALRLAKWYSGSTKQDLKDRAANTSIVLLVCVVLCIVLIVLENLLPKANSPIGTYY